MADLMTNLAELVTEINRIDPQLEDPLRHAKRDCKRVAYTILEQAAGQAWMALQAIESMKAAAQQKDQS
ncbi:hypothetical protein KW843_22965 [Acidovorax sp. sif1233]|uniref:hypothetical protein n=1 Tax=Acidovorax sp. sif1233 TaxID=2854792 RepID=UPI001C450B1D|nr:hypothetical protein [Acidovorax sp. sif1233]MBV7457360.1 hypothetical protein [Acidovorax sp. sif1233]